MPLPLEIDQLVRPQGTHQGHLLLAAPAAARIRDFQRLELLRLDADADSEAQSTAAQHVDLGGLLRDQRGLALRQHQHPGREADARSEAGEKSEEHEDLVKEIFMVVHVGPALETGPVQAHHLIEGGDVGEAEPLHPLRVFAHRTRIGTDVELRKDDPDLHVLNSPSCGW